MVLFGAVVEQEARQQMDFILRWLVESLELTGAQYAKAVEEASRVARLLASPGSRFHRRSPALYAQGSMALRTTVRPIKGGDYDLDLACQVDDDHRGPMALYQDLFFSIGLDPQLATLRKPKNRCVRLDYPGDFHLDVVPGIPDLARSDQSILIPDRDLKDWTPSNPRGFVSFFRWSAGGRAIPRERQALPPLSPEVPQSSTLSVAVQIIKRRRDVSFEQEAAKTPRSIILTTLAATHYSGEKLVPEAVHNILRAIEAQILQAAPKRIVVVNPTNKDEKFSDRFTDDSYAAFRKFISTFRQELDSLLSDQNGLVMKRDTLAQMFGKQQATRALEEFGKRFEQQRKESLAFTPASGISVFSAAGSSVPRHNNFGQD